MNTKETETLTLTDIPIGHFPDRSTRWLFQDKENVRGLLEILESEYVKFVDFDKLTQMNRSFIPDTLREQESDLVFIAPFQRDSETDEMLIYILIEHQSTVDAMMGFRMLFYMTQIWDFQRRQLELNNVPKSEWRFRAILPIVYYTGERRWNAPITLDAIMDFPDRLSRFVPRFDVLCLKIKETHTATLTKTNHPFGWLLTVLQKENANVEALSSALIEAISHINSLDEVEAQQRKRAITYLLHLVLHRRSAEEHVDFIKLIDEHTSEMEVEVMAESIIERTKNQGIEQGTMLAKQEAVLSLLKIRFEDVPETIIQKITSIQSLTRLDSLFEAMVTANTIDEIDLQNS